MKKLLSLLTVFFILHPAQAADEVPAGKAQIVFMRSTSVNALVGRIAIHQIAGGVPKIVSYIPNNRKVTVNVDPGEHIFMVGRNHYRDFSKMTVAGGKRYYVVVTAYWPARFSFRPVRRADSQFLFDAPAVKEMIAELKEFKMSEDEFKEEADDHEKTLGYYKDAWEKWQGKTPAEKAVLTLNAEDAE